MRVLVIEDEDGIREVLRRYLSADGHEVVEAADGRSGLALFEGSRPDFVILDLMLPEVDGYELCTEIRRRRPDVPLIMLTARDDESDKIVGLRLGADDYVTKPFSPRELIARMAAVARRSRGGPGTSPAETGVAQAARADATGGTPEPDGLVIDRPAWQAAYFGQELSLTRSELLLAAAIAGRPMKTFTRPELLERIRGDDADVTDRAVDVHIANLRRKLDEALSASGAQAVNPVETVWGLGYRWRREVPAVVRN